MSRVRVWFAALALLIAASSSPHAVPQNVDLVQLDVVVVDGKGRPMRGLKADEFVLKEDGRAVSLTTFDEMSLAAGTEPRSVVLLLDDAGVPAQGTQTIQKIARAFLDSLRPTDDVSVVRLGVRSDEPFGDRQTADSRLAAYRAASWPFVGWTTVEEALQHITSVFHDLAIRDQQRKIVVCIGSPGLCNLEEPGRYAPRSVFPTWVDALRTAASANIALYTVVPGRARLRGGGLPEFTGGEVFASTYDVGPAIDRIIRDADNYYVLGYWPDAKGRELHTIDVKVNHRGAKVHARRRRGD